MNINHCKISRVMSNVNVCYILYFCIFILNLVVPNIVRDISIIFVEIDIFHDHLTCVKDNNMTQNMMDLPVNWIKSLSCHF